MLLAACGLAAASPEEREPLPLEEAKAVAVKFDSLRTGMSPDQVRHALGLGTVAERMVSTKGRFVTKGAVIRGMCVSA